MAKWIHIYRARLTSRQGSTSVQISDNEMIYQVFHKTYGSIDEFLIVTYDLQSVKAKATK